MYDGQISTSRWPIAPASSPTWASTFRISSVAAIAKTPSAKVSSRVVLTPRVWIASRLAGARGLRLTELGPDLGAGLSELQVEGGLEGGHRVGPHLRHRHRSAELAGDRRKGRVLEAARRDPLGERRRV